MADLDKEFVEYVVKALVSNPDAVSINRSIDDMGVLLELTVDPADMGRVIGKAGATAKSIRTLLRVLGAKNDARVNLKIVEPEGVAVPAEASTEPSSDEIAPLETAAPAEASAPEATPVEAPAPEETPAPAEPAPEPAPVEAPATEATPVDSGDHTDLHQKTRDELAELADLDM